MITMVTTVTTVTVVITMVTFQDNAAPQRSSSVLRISNERAGLFRQSGSHLPTRLQPCRFLHQDPCCCWYWCWFTTIYWDCKCMVTMVTLFKMKAKNKIKTKNHMNSTETRHVLIKLKNKRWHLVLSWIESFFFHDN